MAFTDLDKVLEDWDYLNKKDYTKTEWLELAGMIIDKLRHI
jgi:hypothetical protein